MKRLDHKRLLLCRKIMLGAVLVATAFQSQIGVAKVTPSYEQHIQEDQDVKEIETLQQIEQASQREKTAQENGVSQKNESISRGEEVLDSEGISADQARFAKVPGAQSVQNTEENPETLTDKELAAFIESYMQSEMEKEHIAGAAVTVVHHDQGIFKKGYGYSDVQNKVKVDPDETTFPIASVSKLFTATAIMQLYSEGKLDLSEDVENYIAPLKIENPYDVAVTCGQLLTHSSGMDEGSELLGSTKDAKHIQSEEDYFKFHPLILTEKPGTVSRYSNLGYNLLGYIVERVSGESYEDYIQQHILIPLKMEQSSVRLNDSHMAKGYAYENGEYIPYPFAYQYTSGSSGVIATAVDMERFMRMHLNGGALEGQVVLDQNTQTLMTKRQFTNDESLPGMGYGFIRSERNGELILKHEGALPGYISTMLLIPGEDLGIFVTVNTFSPLPFNFEEAFMERFYPQQSLTEKAVRANLSQEDLSLYAGTYRNYDGLAKSNGMRVGILMDGTTDTKIKDNKDGTLRLEEYNQSKEKVMTTLYEVSPGRFIRADGKGNFAFRVNEKGKVIYAFNEVSHNAFERIPWYREKGVLYGILGITISLMLGEVVHELIRWVKQRKWIKQERLNVAADLCLVVGPIAFIMVMMQKISEYEDQGFGMLYGFWFMMLIGCVLHGMRVISWLWRMKNRDANLRENLYTGMMSVMGILYIGLLVGVHIIDYPLL